MTGTIKRKMPKGYGFIGAPGMAKDLFFHAKELQGVMFDDLQEEDTVEFEVEQGPKGASAINVRRV